MSLPPAADDSGAPAAPVFTPPSQQTAPVAPSEATPPYAAPVPPYGATPAYPGAPSGYAPGAPYAPGSPYTPTPRPSAPAGLASTSLGLGIGGFVTGWVPFVGAVLGGGAVGTGIAALARKQPKGRAITGIALGAVGFITSVLLTIGAIGLATMGTAERDRLLEGIVPQFVAEDELVLDNEVDDAPAVDVPVEASDDYPALDDAGLAAIVADPVASYGSRNLVYGEVQYVDTDCSALVIFDDAQQTNWEAYEIELWAYESGTVSCDDLQALDEYAHLALSLTWRGSVTTEWDDGTTSDVLLAEVDGYEILPPLDY